MLSELNAPEGSSPGRKPPLLGEGDHLDRLRAAGLWHPGDLLRLHLGCGEQHFPGFVNIDYPPEHHQVMQVVADAHANILQLSFPDGSVDEIRLHHVFEHFNRVTALAMLIKWHGWLRSGGLLRIETPDLMGSAKNLLSPSATWKTRMGAARHLAGDHADTWAYHLDHWFPERFERTLTALGFAEIKIGTSSWPREPYLANVEVVAKKCERSAEQLIEAADALLWESTVAEAERPTYEVWQRQLRALLAGAAPARPVNAVAPRTSQQVTAVVFSKDRPLQLDALLRSLSLHCRDLRVARVRVLYTTSEAGLEPLYERVRRENGWAQFVREQDFKSDLIRQISDADYVLFLVDDTMFVREFTLGEILAALRDHTDALGFSLRLGRNTGYCYSLDRTQRLPEFASLPGNMLKFSWVGADSDFGYPLELSSSIYRVKEVLPFLTRGSFSNPNVLEGQIAAEAARCETRPFLLCFDQSVAFSLPLNKVQVINNNRAGSNPACDAAALRQRFSEGQRVDVAAYAGFIPNACHQEVELKIRVLESAKPLVSVIIPCFNQAQYLTEAVESVLGQRYSDWEIIIVNDGSQDNTSEVALGLARNHPDHRIKLLEQANAGLAAARNAGIRACAGQYVLPLDADDKIAPAMLETTVSCLQADPGLAVVYTDAWYFGAVNRSQATIDYDFNYLCHQNHLQYCSLYRREVWERVGGYRTNMTWGYEDWDFWISCGEAGFQAKHVGEPLFHYRVKTESMFTRALKHDLELRAQIVLNHPRLYNEPTHQWARSVLGQSGTAGAESGPTAPHEILCRGEVLTELRRRNAELESELQVLKDWRSKELAMKDAPLKTRELRRILKAYAKRKLNRLKPFPARAT